MGSCFAREIKDYLQLNSYNYISCPSEIESVHGSAMWERVYNTPCILQELQRGFGQFSPTIYRLRDGRVIDPHRGLTQ